MNAVYPWVIGRRPDLVQAKGGMWAVVLPARAAAFVVHAAEKPREQPSATRLEAMLRAARTEQPRDALIGGFRIIALGDAWQRDDLVRQLRGLLSTSTMAHLAVAPATDPWWRRAGQWVRVTLSAG